MRPRAENVRVPHIQAGVSPYKISVNSSQSQLWRRAISRKQLTRAREAALPRSVPQTLAGQPPHLVQQPVASDLEAQGLGRALSMSERYSLLN